MNVISNDPVIPARRVLLVSYPFPPVGGAGVQRVTKFVKFLPRQGWAVSVLTVANPSVPVFDQSIAKDIPAETLVVRARSWEPGYRLKSPVPAGSQQTLGAPGRLKRLAVRFIQQVGRLVLQPDPQILWMPQALAEGKRLLSRVRHQAIVASGPPFSTFLIAAELSRWSRLPLVLDYRDEWSISNEYWENRRLDHLSRSVQERMQRHVLRTARAVIATTRSSAISLDLDKQRARGRAWVTWIYNGFDPDDFTSAHDLPPAEPERFRLAYIGTLWNLTSVAPLVEAVQLIARREPALLPRLELLFAGRRTDAQAELLGRLRNLPCRLVEHPYLDHSVAVQMMRESGALCLLLSELAGAGRVVPAKLFEYMAAGRPILTIAPDGESRELLAGYPGAQFSPGDVAGIAEWLTTALNNSPARSESPPLAQDVTVFSRPYQAKQFAEVLERVMIPG